MSKSSHLIGLFPPSTEDKNLFYEWRNYKSIYKWCRQNDMISRSHHERYWYLVDSAQDKKFWSIVDLRQEKTIGCAGLTDIDYINRRAEFSLYIGKEYQGQGFAKPSLISLFDRGFDTLNLNLIWGECFDGNHAMKIFEDIGMTKEGRRRDFYFKEGRYIGATLYSVTREEWIEKRKEAWTF